MVYSIIGLSTCSIKHKVWCHCPIETVVEHPDLSQLEKKGHPYSTLLTHPLLTLWVVKNLKGQLAFSLEFFS